MNKEDKIFNNRYNIGDLEFEQFGKIELNDIHKPQDSFEEYVNQKIQEELYEFYKLADFYDEYNKSKKVTRSDAAKVFYYFEEKLNVYEDMTLVEKFINIAEFMTISYETLYEEIGITYKEKILEELDSKYGIFKKKKIYRLF